MAGAVAVAARFWDGERRRPWPAEADGASDAVALFIERAADARPEIALTEENAASVARICAELDGLPLAIELAAARVRMLSVAQIARGLSDRFRLLTGGPRTAPPRLKTLRASVDWSHDLLSDAERALLRRLAVFAGGFTLEAVEEVCAGEAIEREHALDLLGSLVDQSLVIAEQRDSEVRYRLLETVRQYGLERLAEAGEAETVRARHRDHYLALAEQAAPTWRRGASGEWLELARPRGGQPGGGDRPRAAERPAARRCASARRYRWWCARAVASPRPSWRTRARWTPAGTASPRCAHAPSKPAPTSRSGWASSKRRRRTRPRRWRLRRRSATKGRQRGRAAISVTRSRSRTHARRERSSRARPSSPGRRATTGRSCRAEQTTALTYLCQGEHAQATRANEEVAALAERLGDPLQVARRWAWAAVMAQFDGRFAEAREAIERLRAAVADTGEPVFEAFADAFAGLVDAWQGEPERPLERLPARLERTLRLGAGIAVPYLLFAIAFAELAADRPEQARDRLEGLVALVEGRDAAMTTWALSLLAEAQRLLADEAAEATALAARASAERTRPRLLDAATPHPRPPGRRARGVDGRPAARARPPRRLRRGRPRDLRARVSGRARRGRGGARRRRGRGAAVRRRRARPRRDRRRPRPARGASTGPRSTRSFARRSATRSTRPRAPRAPS